MGAVQEIQATSARGEIHPGKPTRIVTPDGTWAYAAALPLIIPGKTSAETWVRIRAIVVRGECGFGLLNRAGTNFQDRGFLATGSLLQTIYLQIADAADIDSLIIQNSTPDGTPAEIILEDVSVLSTSSV